MKQLPKIVGLKKFGKFEVQNNAIRRNKLWQNSAMRINLIVKWLSRAENLYCGTAQQIQETKHGCSGQLTGPRSTRIAEMNAIGINTDTNIQG